MHNDEQLDPSGMALGVLGGSALSARGAFRDYTPFRPSLPFFVCEFLKLWLECCPKEQRLMSEHDGIVGILKRIAWRAQDDSAKPQSVGWWREGLWMPYVPKRKKEEAPCTLLPCARCLRYPCE